MQQQQYHNHKQQPVKVVVEQVDQTYQSYLSHLEEKNRQRILLRRQSREAKRRAKLEQGFNLFFNLPQLELQQERSKSRDPDRLFGHWAYKIANSHASRRVTRRSQIKSAPTVEKAEGRRQTWGSIVIPQTTPLENLHCRSTVLDSKRKTLISRLERTNTSDTIQTSDHRNPSQQQDQRTASDGEPGSPRIQKCVPLDCANTEVEQFACSVVRLIIHVDILSNWGDCDFVGLHSVQLTPISPTSNAVCSVREIGFCRLGGDEQVEREQLFPTDVGRIIQNARQLESESSSVWRTYAQNLPFRLSITFQCPNHLDRLRFRLRNCICQRDTCRIGVNQIRLQCLFPFERSDTIEARLKLKELFEVDLHMRNGFTNVVNTVDNTIIINGEQTPEHSARTSQFRSLDLSKRSAWFKHEPEGLVSQVLLDQVSSELLESRHFGIQRKCMLDGSNPLDLLLDCSWSSLDFFNHFHAGRLQTANVDTVDLDGDNRRKLACPPRPSDSTLLIPELPQGTVLTLDIVSTWGDAYYVGLSGIDLFTTDGTDIAPMCTISADPADINVLPGYETDPRVVNNLIDGVNWTRDDMHMWLAPFTPGARHLIRLVLPDGSKPIALIRIWNYNKSRVHTSRGVRELIIYMDDQIVFHGEISRASGMDSIDPNDFCETILFTTDDTILELIAANDHVINTYRTMRRSCDESESSSDILKDRPVTRVEQHDLTQTSEIIDENGMLDALKELQIKESEIAEPITLVEIGLSEPWDCTVNRVGLNGVQLLDKSKIPIPIEQIRLVEPVQDERGSLDDLLLKTGNEINKIDSVWSCAFISSSPPRLRLQFENPSHAHYLRLWNYNGKPDCGVKLIRIVDNNGRSLGRGSSSQCLLIRPTPGHTKFPIAQTIPLSVSNKHNMSYLKSPLRTACFPSLPCGFVYRIDIFSNWFDRYYVGLDGLELLDSTGQAIPLKPTSVFARPSSIDDLSQSRMRNADVRTVDKLIDGITSGPELSSHCWLAPFDANKINQLFLMFDEPFVSSGLRLWNYSRTVERGVREFAVLVDNQVVFRGYLPKAFPIQNICELQQNTVLPLGTSFQAIMNQFQPYVVAFDQEFAKQFPEYPDYIVGSEHRSVNFNSDAME